MKKLTTIILALVLCFAMASPALATYPETWDEAKVKFSLTTSMDEYGNVVEEAVTLYEADFDFSTEEYLVDEENPHKWRNYIVVGSDTEITFTHNGMGDDYVVWIAHKSYVPDDQGRLVLHMECGQECSLRKDGGFCTRVAYDGYTESYPEGQRVELTSGQSHTFTGADLACTEETAAPGTFYLVKLYQEYPEVGYAWYGNWLILVDDARAAEIRAKGPADDGEPFTDVPADAYYHDAVLWALEQGITTGTSATTFGPTETCTRGQVVTFLWRANGCPRAQER